VWSGTTAQGRNVILNVGANNRFSTVTFGATTQGSGCGTTFETTVTYNSGNPTVSNNGSFTVTVTALPPNGSGFSITGTLTTAGTGSGTATFNSTGSPPTGCTASGSTTGNATELGRVGGGAFGGDGGPASLAAVGFVSDVAVNRAGDVFLFDAGNRRVRAIKATAAGR
jgi:hypothetical protein